ncbi:hypothetical protein C4J93_2660 [Pseudomonas sp. R2-37-08W]|nr:hypothetical protein C4J93_2660 [Pseudomonas sp. R2-37-08W]
MPSSLRVAFKQLGGFPACRVSLQGWESSRPDHISDHQLYERPGDGAGDVNLIRPI